jgi:hypothetical protein
MDKEISTLLEKFAATPGHEYTLDAVATEMILPRLVRMSSLDIYIAYLTVIAFPNRSIKHGKILVNRILDVNGLAEEYLQQELNQNWKCLPEWVQEIFKVRGLYKKSS